MAIRDRFNIDVSGGEEEDRLVLCNVINKGLRESGFHNVITRQPLHQTDYVPSMLELVAAERPELFAREIFIASVPNSVSEIAERAAATVLAEATQRTEAPSELVANSEKLLKSLQEQYGEQFELEGVRLSATLPDGTVLSV